jgi:hypothetical protein
MGSGRGIKAGHGGRGELDQEVDRLKATHGRTGTVACACGGRAVGPRPCRCVRRRRLPGRKGAAGRPTAGGARVVATWKSRCACGGRAVGARPCKCGPCICARPGTSPPPLQTRAAVSAPADADGAGASVRLRSVAWDWDWEKKEKE